MKNAVIVALVVIIAILLWRQRPHSQPQQNRYIKRVTIVLCHYDPNHPSDPNCINQDVPADQFIGKPYTESIWDCSSENGRVWVKPETKDGAGRCYFITESEVIK